MKRHKLEPYVNKRMAFTGRVSRFSHATFNDKTIMLKDIRLAEQDEHIADHVWFRNVLWANDLKEGQIIRFNADVLRYKKRGRNKDGRPRVRDIKLDNAGSVTVV